MAWKVFWWISDLFTFRITCKGFYNSAQVSLGLWKVYGGPFLMGLSLNSLFHGMLYFCILLHCVTWLRRYYNPLSQVFHGSFFHLWPSIIVMLSTCKYIPFQMGPWGACPRMFLDLFMSPPFVRTCKLAILLQVSMFLFHSLRKAHVNILRLSFSFLACNEIRMCVCVCVCVCMYVCMRGGPEDLTLAPRPSMIYCASPFD
jgi:hypothetical protein